MDIIRVEQHSDVELLEKMRQVSMLTRPDVYPYADARIQLARFGSARIAPAQRYVLERELLKVRDLRWALREHGVDLFQLDGYVTIYREDDPHYPIDVLPPVVESSVENGGMRCSILNDGMHRVYLARMEHAPLRVVYVENVAFPYYAFPLVGGWDGVEIRSDLPEGYIKKWHRIADYKSLYRNFNSAFVNVGGPRGNDAK